MRPRHPEMGLAGRFASIRTHRSIADRLSPAPKPKDMDSDPAALINKGHTFVRCAKTSADRMATGPSRRHDIVLPAPVECCGTHSEAGFDHNRTSYGMEPRRS